MSDFMNRLSSYNLLNYLLSGVVFASLADAVLAKSFVPADAVAAVFVYYFIGLVISRIGSLALEPALKKLRLIAFVDHKAYVLASQKDAKLDVISEQNNVYRTLATAIGLIPLLWLWDLVTQVLPFLGHFGVGIMIVALFILFVLAYRKQCAYVVSRVGVAQSCASDQDQEA